jgi:hypothetical protein
MQPQVSRLNLAALALLAATAGCAHRANSVMPSAAVRADSGIVAGSWVGSVGGREIGDSNGDQFGAADLVIAADGTFTLKETFSPTQGSSTMQATGTSRRERGRIVLDGHVAAPESRKGEPFVTTVQPRGDALYGNTEALYRGGKVGTMIGVGRLP